MRCRTQEEIQAYIDGYEACYEHIHECLKGRKSLRDAMNKLDIFMDVVMSVLEKEGNEDE